VLLCTDIAARGVDFPDIDAVVQYDAPTDPKTFSHRVGRTARAGRSGRATILLSRGREEEYVQLLAVRKIPLARQPCLSASLEEVDTAPAPADPDAIELMHAMRRIMLTDRDLSDRGAKALVSSVRAYTKHEASFIFRPTDLDYAALSTAFGLLRIPAMPEVRDWRKRLEKAAKKRAEAAEKAAKDKEDGVTAETPEGADTKGPEEEPVALEWTDAEVDWDTFAYASKTREAARLAALAEKKAKASDPERDAEIAAQRKKRKIAAEMREAWSNQKDRKARKEERREKKDNRKKAEWERKRREEGDDALPMPMPEPTAKRKKTKAVDSEDEADYRSLKREVHEERAAKKANKSAKVAVGMFDGLD